MSEDDVLEWLRECLFLPTVEERRRCSVEAVSLFLESLGYQKVAKEYTKVVDSV